MLFGITAAFGRVTDISPQILGQLGIRGLILDIDNTLAAHNCPTPAEGVKEWIDLMRDNDIRLIIMSNNFYLRVKLFADMLGVDYISESKKPFRKGYRLAAMKMGLPKHALAAVGDQITTDVLGANLFRIKMLYTLPMGDPRSILYRLRKRLAAPVVRRAVCLPSGRNELAMREMAAITYDPDKKGESL